ncbi:MAG TPA: hypothetical protein VFE24_05910 [Pirellulales bacterium]|jgi:[acyl-carrier-protein] S-malonyltransferase|nr:hypothetical protein [Pirellulales bacterium]
MTEQPTEHLSERLASGAFALRGYNTTNLGRSAELLEHRAFGAVVEKYLREASQVCGDVACRPVDLVRLVRERGDPAMDQFAEAVALIVAMEIAQLKILEEFFDMRFADAKLAFGYSLGEIAALIAGGVFEMQHALRIPLSLAHDCAELSANTTLGVLFTRGGTLDTEAVQWLCVRINGEGRGVIGISSFLSPNSLLLLGQQRTIDRFGELMADILPKQVHLRKNDSRWPPLHTPIVWERQIPDRAATLMHSLPGGLRRPQPEILSLVTGRISYTDQNCRELLRKWTDHPQRLWETMYETLAHGIDTVIHVGPDPNLFPATFQRVSDNVKAQIASKSWSGFGLRAVSQAVRRPWLAKLLPSRSALLRAPFVEHVILEDWLLQQQVK